eukprot:gene13645-gene10492
MGDPFNKIIDNIPNILYICASPGSGKTYFTKYLLNELFKQKKLKYGIVFSPTKFTGAYDYLPNAFVHSKYDENVLIKLYNLQIQQFNKKGNAQPAFVVFDDCVGSVHFRSAKFANIISTYRHPNLTFIFITQHIKAVPPLLRKCTRFFITFYVDDEDTIKAIR